MTNLVDILEGHAARHPERVAFRFLSPAGEEAEVLRYGELYRRVLAVSALLCEHARPGDRALLLYPAGLDFVVAFWACLYSGVVAVPAFPPDVQRGARALERWRGVVADARPRLVLTTRETEALGRRLGPVEALGEARIIATDDPAVLAAQGAPRRGDPDGLAFLQYTSGSTGSPRGVMVSHGNVLANQRMIERAFGHGPETVVVSWLPVYHDMGLIGCVLQPGYLGVECALMAPTSFLARPMLWLEAVSRYRGTSSGGPNFAYDLCVRHAGDERLEGLDLASWRVAFNGSEPVRSATLERFAERFARHGFARAALYPCYGLAEATLFVTGAAAGAGPRLEARAAEAGRPRGAGEVVGCGRPWLDASVAIVDPASQARLPDGREGEIWVQGPHVAEGYFENSEASAEVFGAVTADGAGPFLRTGDLGFVDGGDLFVVGRRKDLIIVRGRNHHPEDLEHTAARAHPGLAAAAAFPTERDGEEGVVVVQAVRSEVAVAVPPERPDLTGRGDSPAGAAAVIDAAEACAAIRAAVLGTHDIDVDEILLVRASELPRTSSGKVQRHAARRLHDRGELAWLCRWRRIAEQSAAGVAATDRVAATLTPLGESLRGAGDEDRQAGVRALVVEVLESLLGRVALAGDDRRPLTELGLDSLHRAGLWHELARRTGLPLPEAAALEATSVAGLTLQLCRALAPPVATRERAAASAGTAPARRRFAARRRQGRQEPVAIVGMGCRFPGPARDLESYWDLLVEGRSAVCEVPEERFDVERIYSSDRDQAGKLYTRWGGFLRDLDRFDARFFGLTRAEAIDLDPQQRLLLEVTWEALERGGIGPRDLAGSRAGIFMAVSPADYAAIRRRGDEPLPVGPHTVPGNAVSIAAGRLAHFLDLRGPSVALDTACSSSMVALHLACQSLRAGDCDVAIAGGVNLTLAPEGLVARCKMGALSAGAGCRAFDRDGDGYVYGEGCGVVVLQRLDDARREGSRIEAVVRGTAINHDGRASSLTAPNEDAQAQVIEDALARAGVLPDEVAYLEAHGSATELGDPIELRAIARAYLAHRDPARALALGAAKTNLGHLELAAGMAALMKVVLALQHERIPPHRGLANLNPLVDWPHLPVVVPSTPTPWPAHGRPRLAAIDSFGLSGTNVHAIIEEAPRVAPGASCHERPHHLFVLSAKTRTALGELARRQARHLRVHPELALGDVCFTAGAGRAHHAHRLAVPAADLPELAAALDAFARGDEPSLEAREVPRGGAPAVAFVFAGQGCQYLGMGGRLYESEPVFRAAVDRCAELLRPYLALPLVPLLFGEGGARGALNETVNAQPALFAVEWALAELWRSWGVEPRHVLGHSIGELVAACVAGVFDLEDGLRLATRRGALMQSVPRTGEMATVFAGEADVEPVLSRYGGALCLAALNGPQHTVISGDRAALLDALQRFKDAGIGALRLAVSHAAHSPAMREVAAAFAADVRAVRRRPPRLGVVSTLTGTDAIGELEDPDTWARQMAAPVRFMAGVRHLYARGARLFIEIGPDATLCAAGDMSLPDGARGFVPSCRRGGDDARTMVAALGRLYLAGVDIDWAERDAHHGRARVSLPTYPFERRRFWHPAADLSTGPSEAYRAWLYEEAWREAPAPGERAPATVFGAARGAWLITLDRLGHGARLVEHLRSLGARCVTASAGARLERRGRDAFELRPGSRGDYRQLLAEVFQSGEPCSGVVHLGGLDATVADDAPFAAVRDALAVSCGGTLSLVQALGERTWDVPPAVWTVTRGGRSVPDPGRAVDLAQAPVWALARVVHSELPELCGGLVDLDPAWDRDVSAELARELANPHRHVEQVAFRGGRRFVARLVRHDAAADHAPLACDPAGAYLVTGGLGGIGRLVSRHLVERGARHLLLLGRRGPDFEGEAFARELTGLGADVRFAAADVGDEAALAAVLAARGPSAPPIRGVVHTAGVLADELVLRQDWARFDEVLGPKVGGAWALHRLLAGAELDFFVLCSSITAVGGSPGQSNYAVANAFLDALAHRRRAGGRAALSINWGAWDSVGMAARVAPAVVSVWQQEGADLVSPRQGLRALEHLIGGGAVNVAVMPLDHERALRQFAAGDVPPYLSELARAPRDEPAPRARPIAVEPDDDDRADEGPGADPGRLRRPHLVTPLRPPVTDEEKALAEIWQEALDLDGIGVDDSFFELGGHSLVALQIVSRIRTTWGVNVPLRLMFDTPTVRSVAAHVAAQRARVVGAAGAVSGPAPAARPAREEPRPVDVDALSDADADALLTTLLERR